VVVVAWKSTTPGPSVCFESKPVLYIHQQEEASSTSSSTTSSTTTLPRGFVEVIEANVGPKQDDQQQQHLQPVFVDKHSTNDESIMEEARRIRQVIAKHQKELFINHSNLVAIRCAPKEGKEVLIEFVISDYNQQSLPKEIEGISTCVSFGRASFGGYR
jgi:hypothetical protein